MGSWLERWLGNGVTVLRQVGTPDFLPELHPGRLERNHGGARLSRTTKRANLRHQLQAQTDTPQAPVLPHQAVLGAFGILTTLLPTKHLLALTKSYPIPLLATCSESKLNVPPYPFRSCFPPPHLTIQSCKFSMPH